MFAPKNILVPTDFSEFSDNALQYACDIARQHHSTIRLFHVVEVIQQCVADYCLESALVADIQARIAESAEEMIQKQIKRVPNTAGLEIIIEMRQGVPHVEILKEQEERNIDLVVISSHGRRGILGHLGSVTDKVTRRAKCPVLVVKGPQ